MQFLHIIMQFIALKLAKVAINHVSSRVIEAF